MSLTENKNKPADPSEQGVAQTGVSKRGPDEIAQDIARAILARQLPPGIWLREEALGRMYGVSRTKIRAALLILARDNLVETVPDKGTFVSRPSIREAHEVFAARRLLESEIVRLFVASATEREFAQLEAQIHHERAALDKSVPGNIREETLGDFHIKLADLSGNKVLARFVRELVARSSLIAMRFQSSNESSCSSDEHAAFLGICRQGKAQEAVDCMLEHLNRIESSLSLEETPPVPESDLFRALLR